MSLRGFKGTEDLSLKLKWFRRFSKSLRERKVVVVLALFELDVRALDRKFTEVRDYL
jgi:hypothetical protein